MIIDNFTEYIWAIPLKSKNSQTITKEFSNILTTSKRSPLKLETNRGAEFYNSIFQNLLKVKKIQQYSQFTDKGHSTVERVVGTIRIFLMEPVFLKGNADWLSELPSVIKKYIITFHHSIKITPIGTSKKSNEK